MSIVFNDLQNALYSWASSIAIMRPVIWYYPNAPRPERSYISLNITTFNQVGRDYIPRPTDNLGNVLLKGDREFTLNIQAYGEQPFQTLENLRTSLQKQSVINYLHSQGLAYFGQESIIDITTLLDSRFEQRASMDVYFRIAQTLEDELGVITTIEITEEFFNQANIEIFNETYTIPPS